MDPGGRGHCDSGRAEEWPAGYGMVTLPKRTFDALIRWYQTGETRNLRTS